MANPLEQSVRDAKRMNRDLGRLFDRYLGSTRHPRGRILSTYRQARLAMMSSYRDDGPMALTNRVSVVRSLRLNLHQFMGEALDGAVEIGQDSADRQWAHYLAVGAVTPAQRIQAEPRRDELYTGWAGTVDSQMDALEAMVRSDVDPALIYGDGDRLGAMQPAPVNRDGTKWLGIAAGLAFLFWLFGRREPGVSWIPDDLKIQKQAIAQIDNRTTNCCLRVQGQIQDFDKPFRLTGTPRYADKVEWPPFHWWCRTSIVLYMKEFDLGLTQEMLEEARVERARRGG